VDAADRNDDSQIFQGTYRHKMIINDSAAQSLVKIGSPQKLQITDKITSNRIIYSSETKVLKKMKWKFERDA
jgi:hypothetical protein